MFFFIFLNTFNRNSVEKTRVQYNSQPHEYKVLHYWHLRIERGLLKYWFCLYMGLIKILGIAINWNVKTFFIAVNRKKIPIAFIANANILFSWESDKTFAKYFEIKKTLFFFSRAYSKKKFPDNMQPQITSKLTRKSFAIYINRKKFFSFYYIFIIFLSLLMK